MVDYGVHQCHRKEHAFELAGIFGHVKHLIGRDRAKGLYRVWPDVNGQLERDLEAPAGEVGWEVGHWNYANPQSELLMDRESQVVGEDHLLQEFLLI